MSSSVTEIHDKLCAFLREEMGRAEHHACVKIEMFYTPPGDARREPIKSWHKASEADRPYFDAKQTIYLDRMANEMIELAEYNADSYGSGKHRFRIVSHHALGGGRHVHNFVILPSAQDSDGELVGASQELTPSAGGLTLQLMRHLENQQRLNKDMAEGFIRGMREAMTTMREDNERLHALIVAKDNARAAEVKEIEEARSKQHEQQIEAQLVVSETERKTLMTKKVMGLLPVVVSRVLEGNAEEKEGAAGKKSKKWKPSPLSIALGELAESLTEEQNEIIQGSLDFEQKIMLGEAIRLSKKGGGEMLSQIVHDLAGSMKQEQLVAILKHLEPAQQQMFMRAVSLAKAEAAPDSAKPKGGTDSGTDAPPNGAAT